MYCPLNFLVCAVTDIFSIENDISGIAPTAATPLPIVSPNDVDAPVPCVAVVGLAKNPSTGSAEVCAPPPAFVVNAVLASPKNASESIGVVPSAVGKSAGDP